MGKSIHSLEYHKLRERLIAARKKARLTQADVAERLGRPQSFVAKYEGGERRLDVVEFVEIARAVEGDPIKDPSGDAYGRELKAVVEENRLCYDYSIVPDSKL